MSKYFQITNGSTILVDDSYRHVGNTRKISLSLQNDKIYCYSLNNNERFVVVEVPRGANASFDLMVSPIVASGSTKSVYIGCKSASGSPSVVLSFYGENPAKVAHGAGLEVYNEAGQVVYSSFNQFCFDIAGREQGSCTSNLNFFKELLKQDIEVGWMFSMTIPYSVSVPQTQYISVCTPSPTGIGSDCHMQSYTMYHTEVRTRTETSSGHARVGGDSHTNINDYIKTISPSAEKTYTSKNGHNIAVFVSSSCIFPNIRGETSEIYSSYFHISRNASSAQVTSKKTLTFFKGCTFSALSNKKTWNATAPFGYSSKTTAIPYNIGYMNYMYDVMFVNIPV